jgi:hypothetical protein
MEDEGLTASHHLAAFETASNPRIALLSKPVFHVCDCMLNARAILTWAILSVPSRSCGFEHP